MCQREEAQAKTFCRVSAVHLKSEPKSAKMHIYIRYNDLLISALFNTLSLTRREKCAGCPHKTRHPWTNLPLTKPETSGPDVGKIYTRSSSTLRRAGLLQISSIVLSLPCRCQKSKLEASSVASASMRPGSLPHFHEGTATGERRKLTCRLSASQPTSVTRSGFEPETPSLKVKCSTN